MTLAEFLLPVKGGSNRYKVLGVLYFNQMSTENNEMTLAEVKRALVGTRFHGVSKINVADVLTRSEHYVNRRTDGKGQRLWSLTESGKNYVEDGLGIESKSDEIQNDVATLARLLPNITDPDAKAFCEESIKCLRSGALRASVVFLWTGAVSVLRSKAMHKGIKDLNAALLKFDPKSRSVTKSEDFAYIKDSTLLLVLQELSVIDKGERATLEEGLGLRNRCSHPTKYHPGEKKASSFIEDVVGIVFT
ncbi:MAG: hypothetical protein WDN66_03695 [Candidatus Saccharibacteria bacterium]